jgi:hypothetical protein
MSSTQMISISGDRYVFHEPGDTLIIGRTKNEEAAEAKM